jgi:hypothetical protein
MNAMLSIESAIWLLLSAVLLGLIPTAVAYSRCLTDNYIYGKPHFDLVDFATWWVIGIFLFPAAMTLSIIKKARWRSQLLPWRPVTGAVVPRGPSPPRHHQHKPAKLGQDRHQERPKQFEVIGRWQN